MSAAATPDSTGHDTTVLSDVGSTGNIGFIGLGAMGLPMAGLILTALSEGVRDSAPGVNLQLFVNSRRRESADDLVPRGAVWATPAEMAAQVDVIMTMLPDLPELESVIYGTDGLLAGATRRGGTVRPFVIGVGSTSSPAGTRQLGARLAADTGGAVTLVDAPVSGGVEGAAEGSLSLFLGGPDEAVAALAAALEPCGTAAHLGPLGSGQVAKVANQLIVAATTAALAESMVIAERAGLDLAQLTQILGGGYAGSRLLDLKGARFVAHDHSPASPARFMIKDLRYALEEASATATPAPMLTAAAEVFIHMVEAGMGDLDTTGLQAYLESVDPAKGS